MTTDTITLAEASELLGLPRLRSAHQALWRAGIQPVGRSTGRAGANIYSRAEVEHFAANRPGRGARTDLGGVTRSEDGTS